MKRTQLDSPAYHITFICYGCRLPGSESGTVKRNESNIQGSTKIPGNPRWQLFALELMNQGPYILDRPRQKVVLAAIIEVCDFRNWLLYAAHIRSNHVHVVLQADKKPEKVMSDLKAYASRRLNEAGFESSDTRRWARHGSTQYKWTEKEVQIAVDYAIRQQGEPMEYYERENY